jgi:hypothetical protein
VAVELDPEDPFEAILLDMVTLHRKKKKAYGTEVNPLSNFDECALDVPLMGYSPFLDCYTMVVRKVKRIKNLLNRALGDPRAIDTAGTEDFEDSLIDLAVYSVLLIELYRRDYGAGV